MYMCAVTYPVQRTATVSDFSAQQSTTEHTRAHSSTEEQEPDRKRGFVCRKVQAHGKAVGLPTDDDMGNSEVGHNALGSGQVVSQGAALVDIALADGSMFKTDGWKYIEPSFAKNTVHFIGLLSDGGVHSRINQLYQLIEGALLV